MNNISFLIEQTFLATGQCRLCEGPKIVAFVTVIEGGEAFSICRECGEEMIRSNNLRKISNSIWAPQDIL